MMALDIGATGMQAQQHNVEVISNNLANMNTTAYARRRAEFTDLLYQDLQRPGAQASDGGNITPTGVQLGMGVKTQAVYRIAEQGSMQQTGNTFDLAIEGEGYFQVQKPNGDTAYTRDGAFQLSPEGQIVTHEGNTVLPGITVPQEATDVTINKSGEVLAKLDGQTEPQNVGQIQIATFANPAGLEAVGSNMLKETPASGQANVAVPGSAGYGSILQGFLESSNVTAVQEITNLVDAQRAYEMNSKSIQTSDQMMQTVTRMR